MPNLQHSLVAALYQNTKLNNFLSADPLEGRLERLELAIRELQKNYNALVRIISSKKTEIQGKMRAINTRLTKMEAKAWTVKRLAYQFPNLRKVVLPPNTTTTAKIPSQLLPRNTRAILVAVKCDKWMETLYPRMSLVLKQKGSGDDDEMLYNAPMNDFYYEAVVPWDGRSINALMIKVQGSSTNPYTIELVGYIKA